MIRKHVQKSASAAVKYYQLADYMAEGQVLRPELGGKAAERLGVAGSNNQEHFERLCYNQHPLTGEQLTERMRADRICGIDVTFDVPKMWSVLEKLTPHGQELAEIRRQASLDTIREMERLAACRVRKNGRDENRTTGNLAYYRAEHDTDRPVDGKPDMQSHEHYFILNATWDEAEQRWAAANLFDILRDMPYFQAAHNQRLARGAAALGYDIERKDKSFFNLAGFAKSITDKFSRRTAVIEAEAKRKGITDPDEKGQLGAKLREKKSDEFTAAQLRGMWAGSLTKAEQQNIADGHWKARQRQADGYVPAIGDVNAAMQHAADHVFERKSSVPARELLGHALNYGVGQFDVSDAWDHLTSKDRFTALVDGRLFVASRSALAAERAMVRLAGDGLGTVGALNRTWKISDKKLNDEQQAAVKHLLGSKDFVTMVVGAAGVGKTTLLKEAKAGAEAAGKKIFAFAPSSDASRNNLVAEGFEGAVPVATLLVSEKLQEQVRGQIILVDEAAMLGTKDMRALLQIAKDQGTRVWLVGDPKQHRPVQAGEPFDLLQRRAGIKPAVVTKVMRQKNDAYKQLAEIARDHPEIAIDRMQAKEWLREVPDDERYKLLAADYLELVKPERVKKGGRWIEKSASAIVVAPTHKEGSLVTAAIRDGLKAEGRLGKETEVTQLRSLQLTEAERRDPLNYQEGDVLVFTQNGKGGYKRGQRVTPEELQKGATNKTRNITARSQRRAPPGLADLADSFQAFRPGKLVVAVGDRVRITANGKTKDGHRISNGEVVTVTAFTKSGDIVDNRGWVIPKDYGHLRHGYATTSIASQSRSVDHVLLAMSSHSAGAINREQLYVSATRGKHSVKAYTDDIEDLRKSVQKTEEHVSATELAELHKHQKKQARRARLRKHVGHLQRWQALHRPPERPRVDRQHAQQVERSVSIGR